MSQRALDGREKITGKELPDTIGTVYYLASVFRRQKKYDDASTPYRRARVGSERVLGLDHLVTISCSRDYSSMLEEMREWE